MTHKLIKTDNYLLVVDNSDPNKGDYTYNIDNGLISISDKILSLSEMLSRKKIKKVLAHLPLNGSPILEGVDLLPAIEDVQQLANEEYSDSIVKTIAYKKGYNKAREKYKYTLSDIEAAVAFGMSLERFKDDEHKLSDDAEFKGFIQSLHQYPTEFICETEPIYGSSFMTGGPYHLRKTTTSNGRRTWVGKYK